MADFPPGGKGIYFCCKNRSACASILEIAVDKSNGVLMAEKQIVQKNSAEPQILESAKKIEGVVSLAIGESFGEELVGLYKGNVEELRIVALHQGMTGPLINLLKDAGATEEEMKPYLYNARVLAMKEFDEIKAWVEKELPKYNMYYEERENEYLIIARRIAPKNAVTFGREVEQALMPAGDSGFSEQDKQRLKNGLEEVYGGRLKEFCFRFEWASDTKFFIDDVGERLKKYGVYYFIRGHVNETNSITGITEGVVYFRLTPPEKNNREMNPYRNW